MRKILAITIVIELITIAIINLPYYDLDADVQNITKLSNGADEETLYFLSMGETKLINITLPTNATVTKAIVNITGYPILNSIEMYAVNVISDDVNDKDSYDPELGIDHNDGIHVVWGDDGNINGSGNDIDIYYRQRPQTKPWTEIILLSDATPNSNSIEPTMTIDLQNNRYVAWVDDANYMGSGVDNDIFLKNFTQGVWGSISVISDDSNNGNSIEPQLAADDLGNLHLVWVDDGNIAGSGNDLDIVYRKYNVSLSSWELPIIISDGNNNGDSRTPSIFVLDDYIHIAWEDNSDVDQSGTDFDILYKFWNPTIGSWNNVNVVSDDVNDGESHNVSISGDNNSDLLFCWEDNGNINNSGTDLDIVYRRRDAELGNWSPTTVFSEESDSNNALSPVIRHGLFGNLHGIWSDNGNIDNSGNDYDIIHKRFDGISLNFTPPFIVSNDINDGSSTKPKMLIKTTGNSEYFHTIWVDDGDIANSAIDRDIIYRSYVFNYSYPSDLKLDIGDNNNWDWSDNSELNGTMAISDDINDKWFSLTLNSIITNYKDVDQDSEITIPLKFYSGTVGSLKVFDINITYTLIPGQPTNLTLLDEIDDWHVINNVPAFSWELNDPDSQEQGWFEIAVGTSPGNNDLWDPSPVQTLETTITYDGLELIDGETYYFKVRTKDNDGSRWSPWSENKVFRLNTAPGMTSLTPGNGTYIHSINITWSTEDNEYDVTYTTIEAYYNGQWQVLVDLNADEYFDWDISSIAPQEIDLRAKCWDGFEPSPDWLNPEGLLTIHRNTVPMIIMISPPPGEFKVNKLIKIQWAIFDNDVDDSHIVDLYYDTDKDLTVKKLIKIGITDIDWYIWETANIPKGEYYICAVVFDDSASNYSYSDGLIIVDHSIPPGPPPKIAFVFPPDMSMDQSITTDIWVQFDIHIDPSSLSKSNFFIMDGTGKGVSGLVLYDVENKKARFGPDLNLTNNETYIITVTTGVKDLEGNSLDGNGNGIMEGSPNDDYRWSFRTISFAGDTIPPHVISTSPQALETNVDNSTDITIIFSEAMDEASLMNSVMIYDANFDFVLVKNIFYDKKTNTLTIILQNKLADNMTYTVLITTDAKDLAGRNLDGNYNSISEGSPWDNFEFTFTTGEEVILPPNKPPSNGTPGNGTKDSDDQFLASLPIIATIIILILAALSLVFYRRRHHDKFIINNILIIYNDGRLLTRYHRKTENAIDDSAVSSMFTAIQDFIHESFRDKKISTTDKKGSDTQPDEDKSSVDELKYGKMKILIEHDDKFYIAVIGEGKEVPPRLRKALKTLKKDINTKYHKVLDYWDGNMAPIKGMKNLLDPLMKK